jgi:hypothetical protein
MAQKVSIAVVPGQFGCDSLDLRCTAARWRLSFLDFRDVRFRAAVKAKRTSKRA